MHAAKLNYVTFETRSSAARFETSARSFNETTDVERVNVAVVYK